MIRMLEYGKNMNKPPKNGRRKKGSATLNYDDIDLAELYLKIEAREKKIKASKEAIEKLMAKKDDKKPQNQIDLNKLALFLVISFPITGPLYYMWLSKMLGVH
jgi:hypothetical protein